MKLRMNDGCVIRSAALRVELERIERPR